MPSQRPVSWILWSPGTQTALIIIPEEAEVIIGIIRAVEAPKTHLLVYAAPVTGEMMHFNDLTYYSLPSLPKDWEPPEWLRLEIGILAGRLYFNFAEYAALARYLGLEETDTSKVDNAALDAFPLDADGFNDEAKGEMTGTAGWSFTDKPLNFLQEWLAIRRKGQDFTHTPMGYVCQGRQLRADHPFFAMRRAPEKDAGLHLGWLAIAEHGRIARGSGGVEDADFRSDISENEEVEDGLGFGDN